MARVPAWRQRGPLHDHSSGRRCFRECADCGAGSANPNVEGAHPWRQPRALRTDGHLVYGVAGTLRAVAFDLGRLEVTGTPAPVLQGVVTTNVGAAEVAVAANGSNDSGTFTPAFRAKMLPSDRGLRWTGCHRDDVYARRGNRARQSRWQRARHRRTSQARSSWRSPSAQQQAPANWPTQSAMPTAATDHEKGASLRNWPNTNAPSATFAASGSLSMSMCRCSGVKSSIVTSERSRHETLVRCGNDARVFTAGSSMWVPRRRSIYIATRANGSRFLLRRFSKPLALRLSPWAHVDW